LSSKKSKFLIFIFTLLIVAVVLVGTSESYSHSRASDKIEFFKSLEDAKSSIIESSLGVILPKFIPSDIMRVVLNNDKMPQKSTYFYPKVATGMVFNKLY